MGNACLKLQEAEHGGGFGANGELRSARVQTKHSLAAKSLQLSHMVSNAKEDVLDALAEEVRLSKLTTFVAILLGWCCLLMLSALALTLY